MKSYGITVKAYTFPQQKFLQQDFCWINSWKNVSLVCAKQFKMEMYVKSNQQVVYCTTDMHVMW